MVEIIHFMFGSFWRWLGGVVYLFLILLVFESTVGNILRVGGTLISQALSSRKTHSVPKKDVE